ncbi:MAG: hypothetical protein R3264_01045 [Anaerolineae bacterium]|nr:hypothetical protein [Anaerolineae bacterium]
MQIEMSQTVFPPESEVKVEYSFKLNYTAHAARVKVNLILAQELGLFQSGQPSLIISERPVWRVPVLFSSRSVTAIDVGELMVDATTGEVLYSPEILAQFKEKACALAQHSPSATA